MNMECRRYLLTVPTLLLLAPLAHAAPVVELVTNGSMAVGSDNRPIGWTLLNPTGEFFISFPGGGPSGDGGSYFGIQDLDAFAPRQNARGLSQQIGGLVVGTRYTLSFESNEVHTNPNFLAQWEVSFGGETRLSTLTNTAWLTDTMEFTASSPTQTLQFVATFLPGALPQILNLDGVSLTASPVPVPAAGWLILPALAGLMRVAKKRSG